jgi:hypothetical protein
LAGCEVEGPSPPEIEEATQAIQGGYVDETNTAVVGLYNVEVGGLCTGSLLAPNLVLTARHCVSNIFKDSQGVVCSESEAGTPYGASGFYVTTNFDMMAGLDYHPVSEVVITPGSALLCGNDVAILILAENVAPEEAIPLVPRVDYKLEPNEEYYAIGYGQTSDGNSGSAGTRRRRDDLLVYCAEDDCTGVSQFVKQSEWIGDEAAPRSISGVAWSASPRAAARTARARSTVRSTAGASGSARRRSTPPSKAATSRRSGPRASPPTPRGTDRSAETASRTAARCVGATSARATAWATSPARTATSANR